MPPKRLMPSISNPVDSFAGVSATDFIEPWIHSSLSEGTTGAGASLTLTIGGTSPEPHGFRMSYAMETQARPEDLHAALVGALCHVLIEQLPLPGRMEALESLLATREFHETPSPPTPSMLPPKRVRAVVTATTEREIPPIGQD